MKAYFFIFLSLFSFFSLNAQPFEGYVIDQKEDTVKGYLFPAKKTDFFRKIGFSKSKTKTPDRTYFVDEILGFQFLGTRFIGANVLVEDPLEKYLEEAFIRPEAREKRVFLTVEVEGVASFYSFLDSEGRKHFYLKMQDGPFEELVAYEYLERNPDLSANTTIWIKIEDNDFQKVIRNSFTDCDRTEELLSKKVSLKRLELVRLFEKYNKCAGKYLEPVYVNPNLREFPVKWFLSIGINSTRTDFIANAQLPRNDHLLKGIYPSQQTLTFGGNAYWSLSPYRSKWHLGLGLWYRRFGLEQQYDLYSGSDHSQGNFDRYEFRLKVIQWTIPLELARSIKIGQSQLHFGVGAVFAFNVLDNEVLEKQQYLNFEPIFRPEYGFIFPEASNLESAPFVTLGWTWGQVGFKSYGMLGNGILSRTGPVLMRNYSLITAISFRIN